MLLLHMTFCPIFSLAVTQLFNGSEDNHRSLRSLRLRRHVQSALVIIRVASMYTVLVGEWRDAGMKNGDGGCVPFQCFQAEPMMVLRMQGGSSSGNARPSADRVCYPPRSVAVEMADLSLRCQCRVWLANGSFFLDVRRLAGRTAKECISCVLERSHCVLTVRECRL